MRTPAGPPSPAGPSSAGVPFPPGVPSRAGAPSSTGVPFPTGTFPSGVPFPELLETSEPAPSARPRGSRLRRTAARVLLWSLIAVGAFRGVVPAPERPAPAAAAEPPNGRLAAAVATAFLREYLTVGDDRVARVERLSRFTAAGVDLRRSVSIPAGETQYADLVVPADARSVAGGIEVTVLAHVLQVRSGAYRDGGTLAFVVPLAARRGRIAVTGRPRPTALPVASKVQSRHPQTAPAELWPAARRVARQVVVALATGNRATLNRLVPGRTPPAHPVPSGWRVLGVGAAQAIGPLDALAARVPVRVRPPTGQASSLVPVHVRLAAGPRGLAVRSLDTGGSP
jgi:hypothetical protein